MCIDRLTPKSDATLKVMGEVHIRFSTVSMPGLEIGKMESLSCWSSLRIHMTLSILTDSDY